MDKTVTPHLIKSYANRQKLNILQCVLLTKWDRANYNTYKITVTKQHAEYALDNSVWPRGITVRMFEPRRVKNQSATNQITNPLQGGKDWTNRFELYTPQVGRYSTHV